jgi:hypothetical protein
MRRIWPIIAVAIPAVILIWVVVPVSNYLLANAQIADDYMMPVAAFLMLCLVLGLNPLLRLFSDRARLKRSQLAVIYGILMVACLVPSSGMRHMLHPLARTVQRANSENDVAAAYKELDLPPSLFPDSLEYGVAIPDIDSFNDELKPGEPVPWRAWIPPMFAWSGFIVPWYMMMVAMAVIFFAYWRNNERVAFPLLDVMRPLVEVPDEGKRRVPAIFRQRIFWYCFAAVFVMWSLREGSRYWPSNVPAFELRIDLSGLFTELPWANIGWWMKRITIHFIYLGVAFFAPTRISFSVWFFQVIFAVYLMIGRTYLPGFDEQAVTAHRLGAFMVFPVCILWLARAHLARVARSVVKPARNAEDRSYRLAGLSLLLGLCGMLAWLLWVGVPFMWAFGMVLAGFMFSLALMRLIAETGLPLFFPDPVYVLMLVKLFPVAWHSAASMYFSGVLGVWFGPGQRSSVAVVAAHALGINRKHKVKQHTIMGAVFMVVLVVSIVGAGWVHLHMTYNNAEPLCGGEIAGWGRYQLDPATAALQEHLRGAGQQTLSDHGPNLLVGGGLTALLYGLCQFVPSWPLHPIGLLGVGTWAVARMWHNVFFGWLAKVLLLKYGGSRLYTKAKNAVIGLIVGEVAAVMAWNLFAGIRAFMGMVYYRPDILPK